MEGYLRLRLNPWLRRLITRLIAIVPAVLVIGIYGDDKVDDLLVFSQVILSLQLGFAVIPLIHFVSDKETMGSFVIKTWVKVAAWTVACILVFLNVKLVAEEVFAVYDAEGEWGLKILVSVLILLFLWLFVTMTFLPFFKKKREQQHAALHGEWAELDNLSVKATKKIAIALDFTKADEKLIAHALAQGNKDVSFLLLHVVESVSAKYLGDASDDDETRLDKKRIDHYCAQLRAQGYQAEAVLGYKNRVTEIIRIVKDSGADMVVMGAHRHSGWKDYLFGETIEDVRHALQIPVLIVNV